MITNDSKVLAAMTAVDLRRRLSILQRNSQLSMYFAGVQWALSMLVSGNDWWLDQEIQYAELFTPEQREALRTMVPDPPEGK